MTEREFSLHKLAKTVRYDVSYLSRVANDRQNPSQELAARLDEALGAGGDLAKLRRGKRVRRRRFLSASMTAAGLAVVPPQTAQLAAGRRVGPSLVATLRQRCARFRRLDDVLGGAETYGLYVAELDATSALIDDGAYSDTIGRALLSVAAEQAQQAGWAAFDAGWHTHARRLFKTALSAATDSGDVSLVANSMAYLAYQKVSTGQPGADEADASCRVAERNTPPAVRALLFERAAWAHAVAGNTAETDRALTLADEALGHDRDGVTPNWALWVDRTELQIMTGRCWAQLGRHDQAAETLETALAAYDDTHARDKALYSTWLADAYLDAGEVEQGARVAGRALDLSADVASVRPRQRIDAVLRRLEPHRSVEQVDDVLTRATWWPKPSFDPPS